MKTLQNAVNSLSARLNNERNSIIKLTGKTKPVTVKGRGTYNVPLEVFNKIIEASKVAGIDPKQGLAIAIKESSGYTDKNRINTYYTGAIDSKHHSHGDIENGAGPSTIVSNWQFFDNNPYIGLLKGWENSGWDVNRVEQDAQYQFNKHQSDYNAYEANNNEDILVNMFKLPLNKINPNEKGYVSDIQNYMQNMSYKFGGKLNEYKRFIVRFN